jgi:hypothetical protein
MHGPTCIFWANLTHFSLQPLGSAVKDQGVCLTYGGYLEANVGVAGCVGWDDPLIGGQTCASTSIPWSIHLNVSLMIVSSMCPDTGVC